MEHFNTEQNNRRRISFDSHYARLIAGSMSRPELFPSADDTLPSLTTHPPPTTPREGGEKTEVLICIPNKLPEPKGDDYGESFRSHPRGVISNFILFFRRPARVYIVILVGAPRDVVEQLSLPSPAIRGDMIFLFGCIKFWKHSREKKIRGEQFRFWRRARVGWVALWPIGELATTYIFHERK